PGPSGALANGESADFHGSAKMSGTTPPSGDINTHMAQDTGPVAPARHYYDAHDLLRFQEIGANAPELAKKFFDWYGAVFADGALSAREKSLIALAVAH